MATDACGEPPRRVHGSIPPTQWWAGNFLYCGVMSLHVWAVAKRGRRAGGERVEGHRQVKVAQFWSTEKHTR